MVFIELLPRIKTLPNFVALICTVSFFPFPVPSSSFIKFDKSHVLVPLSSNIIFEWPNDFPWNGSIFSYTLSMLLLTKDKIFISPTIAKSYQNFASSPRLSNSQTLSPNLSKPSLSQTFLSSPNPFHPHPTHLESQLKQKGSIMEANWIFVIHGQATLPLLLIL